MAKKTNRGAADDIALMATSGAGVDLNAWLNQQGIGAETPVAVEQVTKPAAVVVTAPAPDGTGREPDGTAPALTPAPIVDVSEQPTPKPAKVKGGAEPAPTQDEPAAAAPAANGKTGKQRERYEGQFFQRIEGFKKPTNMMYMSEKTYRLLTFLLRCSKESNAKITMPEILENIVSQHIRDNEVVIGQMRQEHLERQAQGF